MPTDTRNWRGARKLGVFGSWRPVGIDEDALRWAHELGKLIATNQCILITGGSGGIVFACRHGCRDAGGMNVAVLPEGVVPESLREKSLIDIAIPTGLGLLGRMPILTETADYAIAIGGGAGTLIEVALMYLQRKIVLVIETLRRPDDPAISNILSRRSRVVCRGVPLIRGYLDSKPENLVEPVHVAQTDISPAMAFAVATDLYYQLGREPTTASDVGDG